MALPMPRPAPRLPGIYVETAPPPRTDTLPRLDIAGFVGFAASGPLDLPVPVEDVARFRDIFGPDLVLARDEARGEDHRTLLGPAVEAFFANGGKRAFVVRVAGPEAVLLEMGIPGLVAGRDVTRQATTRARSPGLWPAGLAADTRLNRRRLIAGPGGALAPSWAGADAPPPGPAILPDGVTLRIAPGTRAPVPGDLIEATFPDAGLLALIVVQRVTAGAASAPLAGTFWRRSAASPPTAALGIDDPGLAVVAATDPLVQALLTGSPPPVVASLSVLSFDLVLWQGERIAQRMDDCGFAEGHPRYWARLPLDAVLFGEVFGRPTRRLSAEEARFETEASAPRFALAGPDADAPGGIWLPHQMQTFFDRARAQAPNLPPVSRLEAEGLATFSDALFLDERFARLPTGGLGAELSAHYAHDPLSTGPALHGLYALAPIGEVAMIAVPDAVHRPWSRELVPESEPLAAPFLDALPRNLDGFGRLVVNWSAVPGAMRYRLELAQAQDFVAPQVVTAQDPHARVTWPVDCPRPVAARVRAERGGEAGPWSNIRASLLPEEDFETCGRTDPDLMTLLLVLDAAASPGPVLSWSLGPAALSEPGDTFELQTGTAPGLEDAEPVAMDPAATAYAPPPVIGGAIYARVRLRRGTEVGPWSITERIGPSGRRDWALDPEADYAAAPLGSGPIGEGVLTAVHRAMLRFAAARADFVALISLPRHYREREVMGHLARLSPLIDDEAGADDASAGAMRVPGLRFGEERAMSYGAMQHPWISVIGATSPAFQPPDGAAAGQIAGRALRQGVWIAAANQPISGAVALSPVLGDATLARLIDAQVNPVRRDPRGFVIFNAETLSPESDVRALPVRLLMILLRRLALREGATYVFEPHSDDFRALVRRRFERMLSIIHQRGGFAGQTPAESYRVVTDESVNPPTAVDAGRFTVELRVAPSRPMRYLNIRLLRFGVEQISVEEGV
jgi:hypothetical protein